MYDEVVECHVVVEGLEKREPVFVGDLDRGGKGGVLELDVPDSRRGNEF